MMDARELFGNLESRCKSKSTNYLCTHLERCTNPLKKKSTRSGIDRLRYGIIQFAFGFNTCKTERGT